MDQMLYFLHRDEAKANHAGSKAVRDAENIFLQLGMKPIPVYSAGDAKGFTKKMRHLGQLTKLMTLPAGSSLFIQYPMYRLKRDYVDLLGRVRKIRKIRLIFLIHDLEIIRRAFPENPDLALRDMKMLDVADRIIVHNRRMADYLIDTCHADPRKLISLDLFDYLTPDNDNTCGKKSHGPTGICVAGNLDPNKSGYLKGLAELLPDDISLELYGVNYSNASRANVTYHGSFDADILPDMLVGSFGLVWDGPDTESCSGNMGNYLKYNNPHKLSLYIAAAMPVIIWKEAAAADVVARYGIGLSVSTLDEIPDLLLSLRKDTYNEYISNIKPLCEKVRHGFYLKKAVKRACLVDY